MSPPARRATPGRAADAALWQDLDADVFAEYRARTPRSAAWAAEMVAGSLVHLHFTPGPVTDYQSTSDGSAGLARTVHLAVLCRGVFGGAIVRGRPDLVA